MAKLYQLYDKQRPCVDMQSPYKWNAELTQRAEWVLYMNLSSVKGGRGGDGYPHRIRQTLPSAKKV